MEKGCLRRVRREFPLRLLSRETNKIVQPSLSSQEITRKSASNLALAFILLPKEKRKAMVSLYAFCRLVDDIADEETASVPERAREINRYREGLQKIFDGLSPEIPFLEEFAPIIRRYHIPYDLLNDLLKGMEMDLEGVEYRTWEDLDLYCYRVASSVGLMSLRIFGFTRPETEEYALALGRALQYTNILRDVKTDQQKGRLYLPSQELARFNVSREDIFAGRYTENYRRFAEAYKERALGYYRRAREVLPEVDRPNMIAAELMGAVYWQLFLKLIHFQYDVFSHERIRLTKCEKVRRILLTWLRFKLGLRTPHYGVLKGE